MNPVFANVLGWPCMMCWFAMWIMIIYAGGRDIKKTLLQPSVLIIMALSSFTILPGYLLYNTDARLFRFDASEADFLQLGNFYGLAFFVYGTFHMIFAGRAPKIRQHRTEILVRKREYFIVIALVLSLVATLYYVKQVGFITLQTRDFDNRQQLEGQGLFAILRFIPYSCLCVLGFSKVKKIGSPTWLYLLTCVICFAYGILFVERLLFVFTVLIAAYFYIVGNPKLLLPKIAVSAVAFVGLFSLISAYRFMYDKDYNLAKSTKFSGDSLVEQISINLIFFDNITPIAQTYGWLSQKDEFWGPGSYYVTLLQFVPSALWPEKTAYIEEQRVVKRLGTEIGSIGTPITPSPWGEALVCLGGHGFLGFAILFAAGTRYLDFVSYRIERKSYAKQFAFACLVLNLIFNARNPAQAFVLFSLLFWLPAYLLFRYSYQFSTPKRVNTPFPRSEIALAGGLTETGE